MLFTPKQIEFLKRTRILNSDETQYFIDGARNTYTDDKSKAVLEDDFFKELEKQSKCDFLLIDAASLKSNEAILDIDRMMSKIDPSDDIYRQLRKMSREFMCIENGSSASDGRVSSEDSFDYVVEILALDFSNMENATESLRLIMSFQRYISESFSKLNDSKVIVGDRYFSVREFEGTKFFCWTSPSAIDMTFKDINEV